MTAQYPGEIYTPRALENRPGVVYDPADLKTGFAEDQINPDNEIVAIEIILGLNPQGIFDTVVDRLDALDSTVILESGGSFIGPVTMTVDNNANYVALTINANDTTNNTAGLRINSTITGWALLVDPNGNTGTSTTTSGGVFFTNTQNSGICLNVYTNHASPVAPLASFRSDNVGDTQPLIQGMMDGTGDVFKADQNGNGYGLYIDKDCSVAAVRSWAMKIDSDNVGGSGAIGCGIDMSSFSTTEPVFKFPTDATDPTAGGGASAGRVAIDIAGVTKYLAYY